MWPDALKGIKRIRASVILDILLIIIDIAMLCIAITMLAVRGSMAGSTSPALGVVLGSGARIVATAVLTLIGFVLHISGIVSASKDEPAFKKAIL